MIPQVLPVASMQFFVNNFHLHPAVALSAKVKSQTSIGYVLYWENIHERLLSSVLFTPLTRYSFSPSFSGRPYQCFTWAIIWSSAFLNNFKDKRPIPMSPSLPSKGKRCLGYGVSEKVQGILCLGLHVTITLQKIWAPRRWFWFYHSVEPPQMPFKKASLAAFMIINLVHSPDLDIRRIKPHHPLPPLPIYR